MLISLVNNENVREVIPEIHVCSTCLISVFMNISAFSNFLFAWLVGFLDLIFLKQANKPQNKTNKKNPMKTMKGFFHSCELK